jgi:hypothetical protein
MTAAELVTLLGAIAAVITAAAAFVHSIRTRGMLPLAPDQAPKVQTEMHTPRSELPNLDPPASVMKTMEERGLLE